ESDTLSDGTAGVHPGRDPVTPRRTSAARGGGVDGLEQQGDELRVGDRQPDELEPDPDPGVGHVGEVADLPPDPDPGAVPRAEPDVDHAAGRGPLRDPGRLDRRPRPGDVHEPADVPARLSPELVPTGPVDLPTRRASSFRRGHAIYLRPFVPPVV